MKNNVVKFLYLNGYKEAIGYTTQQEIAEARAGEKSFIWFSDSRTDIKGGKVISGWTLDYLDIIEIYDEEGC